MKLYDKEPARKLLVVFGGEFCGTAMLLSLICASCVNTILFPSNLLMCAFSCGFSVAVCIQCFGCVSGAHINPAVSLASFILGNISFVMMIVYIVAQYTGACLGYAIFLGMVPDEGMDDNICLTLIHPLVSNWRAFFVEFILTCCLVYLCCGVWDNRNARFGDGGPIKFAVLVAMVTLTGANYTGASINPARSFAPALFHMNFDRYWLYLLSHIAAAIVAPLTWVYFFSIDGIQGGSVAEEV